MADRKILDAFPWICNELFEKCLTDQGEAIKVDQFAVEPAFGNGENYSSQLLKVNVKYFDKSVLKSKQLIIKTTLGEKLVRSRDVFAKEICIYQEIIPQFVHILNSVKIPAKLAPK